MYLDEDPADYYQFFQKNGDALLSLVEKVVATRIREDDFDKLGKNQAAYLGYYALLGIMKQLSMDINAREEKKALDK